MPTYSCAEPSTYRNIHGGYSCQEWVLNETESSDGSYSLLEELAITKDEMVSIGTQLATIFAICIAFAIVAKAVKML